MMQSAHSSDHVVMQFDSHQSFVHPSSSSDTAEPQPTYVEVIDMISAANKALDLQCARIPKLRDELKLQFADGIEQCKLAQREPVTLLRTRLRMERRTFDAYNKHRLNDRTNKGEDIEEDLESFPLRFEVVERGFAALTEDLLPIYQTADHDANASMNTDFVLAATQTKNPKASASGTLRSIKLKTGRTVENYDKLEDAPRPNLDFPVANVLITEMAAFIPNSIKSWDVIDRVCGSGLGQYIYAIMINHYREMARGTITANSTYRMFKGPISKRAKFEPDHEPSWNEWTPTLHDKYYDAPTFDALSVSVAGFRTPADGKTKTSHAPIPLKDLAIGVKNFPSGNDALDFTRVVRYAADHPNEIWMYPTDYNLLLAKLGGSATVTAAHTDAAVIARWTAAQQKTGSMTKNAGRKRDQKGRLQKDDEDIDFDNIDETESEPDFDDADETDSEDDADSWKKANKRKRGTFDDSDDSDGFDTRSRKSVKRSKLPKEPCATRQPGKGVIHRPSRLRRELFAADIGTDSDSNGYDGLKSHKKKLKKAPAPEIRRSSRANKFTQSFVMTDDFEDEEDPSSDEGEMPDLISRYGIHATKKEVVEPPHGRDLVQDPTVGDTKEKLGVVDL